MKGKITEDKRSSCFGFGGSCLHLRFRGEGGGSLMRDSRRKWRPEGVKEWPVGPEGTPIRKSRGFVGIASGLLGGPYCEKEETSTVALGAFEREGVNDYLGRRASIA